MLSDKMKVILLGSTGKLGKAFASYLSRGSVTYLTLSSVNFDARKPDELNEVFDNFLPTLVINCVALNGLKKNFLSASDSFAINSLFPLWLAKKSKTIGFTLVHFSTDSVFNDLQKQILDEDCGPAPRSIYGNTKLCGEYFVRANSDSYYIVRLPLLFGGDLNSGQLIENLLNKIIVGKAVWLNPKLKICPTYIHDIPKNVFEEILSKEHGVYHLLNEGEIFLPAFISKISEAMDLEYKLITTPEENFFDLETKELSVILESNKIKKMRRHDLAIDDYVKTLIHH
jgi:dTDP-4-dehydrorhamnose reductase